jgi:hypothetical protein
MGGPQMADHIAMYRRNGISKLYSFDIDYEIVRRQSFNAPTDKTICETHSAADLPAKLDEISEKLDIDHLIVWFDFTGNKRRGIQLAEFQTLLQSLSVGDIARIALDASPPSEKLKNSLPKAIRDKPIPAINALLSQEFGDFHPEDFELESRDGMRQYLTHCIQHLCDRATGLIKEKGFSFLPLLQTYYIDSTPMFTATILVQNDNGQPPAPDGFGYLAANWDDIENLEVPELTAREKSFLDRLLDRNPEDFTDELGYNIARTAQMSRQWASFKRFHRFLPQFLHVEIK